MSLNPTVFFKEKFHLDFDVFCASIPVMLKEMDFGELYCSYGTAESFSLQSELIRSASSTTTQGFGLRGVIGEQINYAHSNVLDEKHIRSAGRFLQETSRATKSSATNVSHSTVHPKKMYASLDPNREMSITQRVTLLREIDTYARQLDPRVKEVLASLQSSVLMVIIVDEKGNIHHDVRPMVKLGVVTIVQDGDKQDQGYFTMGGRHALCDLIHPEKWQNIVKKALRHALISLEATTGPGGKMPIVMENQWNGVLFHEAVGHGLEADANYQKTSVYHDKMHQTIARPKVTLVDSAHHFGTRGALTIDDEGTPGQETTLIKEGRLVSYLHDRRTSRLMKCRSTGSGRRESYAHAPMPRMRNTYLLSGDDQTEDMIASIDHGIYVAQVGGGSVDIAKGTFVFDVSEAYEIKKGKKGKPLKDMTLIGDGQTVLKNISMVGPDSALDPGMGSCGKKGQWVPVGVGQPTLKVDAITVGGQA